ncbi:MAG TPA: oxidoreductase [Caulobacteraceae bacterium]
MSNSGKVAIVTGASSGIGRATAEALVKTGYRVYGASRSPKPILGVENIVLDVTDDASVEACVATVLREAGAIDLLVNNAGVALIGAIEDSTVAQAQALFEVNLFGAMRMAKAVLPDMRRRRGGRIINMSSVGGFLPAPFSGLYASSKFALEGFSEALDHEVRRMGIRVSLLEPAFTASDIADNSWTCDAPSPAYDAGRKVFLTRFKEEIGTAPGSQTVADAVLAVLRAKNPAVRVPVGGQATTLARLRRFLPATTFEGMFRKQFNLDTF